MEEGLTPEKAQQILDWFQEGKIRPLVRGYAIPSEAFVLGITPRMVHQVLEKHKEEQL